MLIEIKPVGQVGGPGAYDKSSSLVNATPAPVEVQIEQPWHRQAAYLFASGYDRQEVAKVCERSVEMVKILLRQPWFQKQVTELCAANGKDILDLFKAEALNSLNCLVELRDSNKMSGTVRLNSALAILDRAPNVGKPLQRIETSKAPVLSDPVAERDRLRAELSNVSGNNRSLE